MNSLDSSINKNRSFFVKIEETGLGQLLRFIKNRPVTIQNIQNLRNIEKPKTENSSNKAKKLSKNPKTGQFTVFGFSPKFKI
jgi:hypothetical protein